MYKILAVVTLAASALLAPLSSQAHVDVGVSIGVPFYGAPYYYAPAPVWRGPAVVYRDYPRPYWGSRYYPARPYYRGYRDGYRDGRYDDRRRGDWRRYGDDRRRY